jgi:hypothetical protein
MFCGGCVDFLPRDLNFILSLTYRPGAYIVRLFARTLLALTLLAAFGATAAQAKHHHHHHHHHHLASGATAAPSHAGLPPAHAPDSATVQPNG